MCRSTLLVDFMALSQQCKFFHPCQHLDLLGLACPRFHGDLMNDSHSFPDCQESSTSSLTVVGLIIFVVVRKK